MHSPLLHFQLISFHFYVFLGRLDQRWRKRKSFRVCGNGKLVSGTVYEAHDAVYYTLYTFLIIMAVKNIWKNKLIFGFLFCCSVWPPCWLEKSCRQRLKLMQVTFLLIRLDLPSYVCFILLLFLYFVIKMTISYRMILLSWRLEEL